MEGKCFQDLMPLVMLCFLVLPSRAFNIDVSEAKVFGENPGIGFGTAAEFIQTAPGNTQILVGAPQKKITDKASSGVYYICSPLEGRGCDMFTSTPQPPLCERDSIYSRPPTADASGHIPFAEEGELFGQTIAVLSKTTLLVCGPMWSDLCYWGYYIIFNIGRCHIVSTQRPDEPGYTPYLDRSRSLYQRRIDIGHGFQTFMYYGRAQFGFSAASDGEGRAVIGAPGFSVSRGGFAVFDEGNTNFTTFTKIVDSQPENYFGYSVAVGNFCGARKFCFAVSDRSVYGAVRILDSHSFEILQTLNGTQEYASYGYSLCAMDINGDGWTDLLVGAPTFTASVNDSKSDDEGRVFVYISGPEVVRNGEESFNLSMTLSGDDVSFARFGAAITNIGDINRDSYLDVAVGAPLEGEGVGAVYVYLGGPQGVVTPYTQKITGRDFQPPLKSFGFYIAQPTTDISSYDYPDFAVGCPESDSVVLLRTRRIINAKVRIVARPNPVATDFQCRPDLTAIGIARASGCFEVDVYFGHVASNDRAVVPDFDLDYTLSVDTLVNSATSRRVGLLFEKKDSSYFIASTVSGTVTVSGGRERREHFTVILRDDLISRNRFTPVRMFVEFSLNTTLSTDVPPVLNQSVSNSATEEVTFKNDECGLDQKCQGDLTLSGYVQHEPFVVNYKSFNVVNKTRRVELHLQLENQGETVFATQLTTNITGLIAYKTVTDSRARSHFVCSSQENVTSGQGQAVTGSVLVCNNFAQLLVGEVVNITLQFQADTVPFDPQLSTLIFDVQAMPYYGSENPEGNAEDNSIRQASQLRIVADLEVDGTSQPRSVHVEPSDEASLQVQHKLFLRNRGPSFLPDTTVNISVPFRYSAGSQLLEESSNVTITYEAGKTMYYCTLLLPTGESQGGTNAPPSTSPSGQATTPPQTTPPQQTRTVLSSTTTDPFGQVQPTRRRRRRQAGNQQGSDVASDSADDRLLRMDCDSYMCVVFRCPLPALQRGEEAVADVTLSLARAALPFSDKIDTLQFSTRTQVKDPDHPLFFPWSKRRELEVETHIYLVKARTGGEVNIWIIIGCVIGGLLLLALIALIAWKLGFFRRKDRAKLQKLKRQSGFYNDSTRRSTKSNKSRSSSTGGSVKEKSAT